MTDAVSFDGVSRGGRGCESERREGQSASMLTMWRLGGVQYVVVQWHESAL